LADAATGAEEAVSAVAAVLDVSAVLLVPSWSFNRVLKAFSQIL